MITVLNVLVTTSWCKPNPLEYHKASSAVINSQLEHSHTHTSQLLDSRWWRKIPNREIARKTTWYTNVLYINICNTMLKPHLWPYGVVHSCRSKQPSFCGTLEYHDIFNPLISPRAYLYTWSFVHAVLISHLKLHASFWSSDHCS